MNLGPRTAGPRPPVVEFCLPSAGFGYTLYTMPAASTAQRILDAARASFGAGGVDAVTVRGVAADVGITPMAIYRHFAGKEALVDALVLEGLDRWAKRLATVGVVDPL